MELYELYLNLILKYRLLFEGTTELQFFCCCNFKSNVEIILFLTELDLIVSILIKTELCEFPICDNYISNMIVSFIFRSFK